MEYSGFFCNKNQNIKKKKKGGWGRATSYYFYGPNQLFYNRFIEPKF